MEKEYKNEKKAKIQLKEQIKKLTNEVEAMAQTAEIKDNRPKILNKIALAEIKICKIDQKDQDVRHDVGALQQELDLFTSDPRELSD